MIKFNIIFEKGKSKIIEAEFSCQALDKALSKWPYKKIMAVYAITDDSKK